MASMTSPIPTTQAARMLFGGIDTHKNIHVAALLDSDGGLVGSASFPTTVAGYRQLLGWMHSFGTVILATTQQDHQGGPHILSVHVVFSRSA